MLDLLISFFKNLFLLLADIAPYFLLGLLVAGFLKVFLPQERLSRHLGRGSFLAVFKAALLGIPLPLCSCGVLPVAVSLRRHGAGLPAVVAFLVATPQTSVDAIFITFGLFGGAFALAYPLAALVAGLMAGTLAYFLVPRREDFEGPSLLASQDSGKNPLFRALHFSFFELLAELAKPLTLGLLLAALLATAFPPGFLGAKIAPGAKQYLLMLLFGVPIYTCSTGSLPLAYSFYLQGFSPGSLLVFLMSGPATNVTSLVVVKKIFGRRAFLIYAGSLILTALAAGAGLDLLVERLSLPLRPPALPEEGLSTFKELSALLLAALLLYHLTKPYLNPAGG